MNAELTAKPSHLGLWWLPEHDNDALGGMLSWSESKGLSLETIGSFSDDMAGGRIVRWPVLHGLVHEVGQLTLRNCLRTRLRHGPFDADGAFFSDERYVASMALTHRHFPSEADMVFSRIRLVLSRLADWTVGCNIPVAQGRAKTAAGTEPQARMVSGDIPGGRVALAQLPYTKYSWHKTTRGHKTALCVDLVQPLHIDGWLRLYVNPLQDLLTLATDEPNRVEDVRFDDISVFATEMPEHPPALPVGVLFQSSHPGVRAEEPMHPLSMLLRFDHLPHDFERSLNNWFAASERHESTLNLYFSAVHSPDMFAEQRFLSIVQAAETYHRQKYGKNYTLKDRVRLLVDRYRQELGPIIADSLRFAVRVYDTRNYFTHYETGKRERAAHGRELHLLTQRVAYVVRACLLSELGFDDRAAGGVFANFRHFKFIADEVAATGGP